jgi:hypothetical protein
MTSRLRTAAGGTGALGSTFVSIEVIKRHYKAGFGRFEQRTKLNPDGAKPNPGYYGFAAFGLLS